MKEYWTIKNKKSGSWWCRASCFTSQKHARGTYTHRVHALEAMISIIQDCPDIEKDVTLVRVTVKTKPRGAKVGTWAWACEQMLAKKWVKRGGMMRSYAMAQMGGVTQLCARSATDTGPFLPHAPTEFEMLSIDWQVVP